MAFVSSSLTAAKERGSIDEELEGMLIQARCGINQGIDEVLVEIKEVNQLQKDFFNGDVEKAYQQVLQLGFDDEQLSNLSLGIQQQQTSYMSKSYTEVASFKDNNLEQLNKQLKPILDFVEQFRQVDKSAGKLFGSVQRDKVDYFEKLLQSVLKAEFGDSDNRLNHFEQFIKKSL